LKLKDVKIFPNIINIATHTFHFISDVFSSITAYISHSASRERLAYIFRALLPPIPEDAVLLDIGSRLGAVLYGVGTNYS